MWIRESHLNESFSTNYSHIICHDPFVQRTSIFERVQCVIVNDSLDTLSLYLSSFLSLNIFTFGVCLHFALLTKCYVFKSVFYAFFALLIMLMWISSCDNAQ